MVKLSCYWNSPIVLRRTHSCTCVVDFGLSCKALFNIWKLLYVYFVWYPQRIVHTSVPAQVICSSQDFGSIFEISQASNTQNKSNLLWYETKNTKSVHLTHTILNNSVRSESWSRNALSSSQQRYDSTQTRLTDVSNAFMWHFWYACCSDINLYVLNFAYMQVYAVGRVVDFNLKNLVKLVVLDGYGTVRLAAKKQNISAWADLCVSTGSLYSCVVTWYT